MAVPIPSSASESILSIFEYRLFTPSSVSDKCIMNTVLKTNPRIAVAILLIYPTAIFLAARLTRPILQTDPPYITLITNAYTNHSAIRFLSLPVRLI